MTRIQRVKGLATAVVLLVAVTSCVNDGNDPPAVGTTSVSSPSPTTSSPTPGSPTTRSSTPPSETASAAASALVRKYFTTIDRLRQDAKQPASDLEAVASSTQLTAQKKLLEAQRQGGMHQVGNTKVVELKVESVNLDRPATALIDICWDVSGVDVLDADGNSVVTADRKEVGWTRYTLTNDRWPKASTDGWRVSAGTDLDEEPCAGS